MLNGSHALRQIVFVQTEDVGNRTYQDVGDNLVPNGLSRDCKVFCSRSKYPGSSCAKLASRMPPSFPKQPYGAPFVVIARKERPPFAMKRALAGESLIRGQHGSESP